MTGRSNSALSLRIAILVAIVALPTLLLSLYFTESRRNQERESLRAQSLVLARGVAQQQGITLRRLKAQLDTLTRFPEMLASQVCSQRLRSLMLVEPAYFQIIVADPKGEIGCTAEPSPGGNIADRAYFQLALKDRQFTLSSVLQTRGQQRWAVIAAQPVMVGDELKAVIVAALDFSLTQEILASLRLPDRSIISMSDSDGRIIARWPEPERFIGKMLLEAQSFKDVINAAPEGFVESAGLDGVARIVAYSKVPEADLYVRVGVPHAAISKAGADVMQAGIFAVLAVILITASLGWFGGTRLLLRPIRQLSDAAAKLGQGDWSARTGLAHHGHILGPLAEKLDELAFHGQNTTRAFRTLSAGNRTLLRESSEPDLLEAMCRVAVSQGGYRLAFVTYLHHDDAKSVEIMAHYGTNHGFLESLALTWDENSQRGHGSVGTAIRNRRPDIVRSLQQDERFAPWREQAQAHGFGSIISLPLKVESKVIGTFTLLAAEEDSFNEQEVALLEEMAQDLSFGIQVIRANERRQHAEREAERVLTHDSLTGLPNRALLLHMLSEAIEQGKEHDENPIGVLSIYLPRLQEVFDGFGYDPGNMVIRQVAERLAAIPEITPMLARLSPNEFGLFLIGQNAPAASKTAKRIQAAFQEPVPVRQAQIDVAASIGMSFYPGHGDDAEALLRRASIAAREGANKDARYFIYRGATERENPERLAIAAELRSAISRRELQLVFQPKFDLTTGEMAGSEALVRWPHPTRGFLSPAKFVPLAEETGLIRAMTSFVVDAAIRQQHAWSGLGRMQPIAVNLSAKSLYDPNFLDTFEALLETWGVPPNMIDIELTESALADDPEQAKNFLSRLRQLGSKIYIDDFGTGYSSLNYLVSLPVHALKIDRSFVRQMSNSREAYSVVASIISMAHNLDLRVLAEGVETREDMEILRKLGCDEAQGFLYSQPMSAAEFAEAYLRSSAAQ